MTQALVSQAQELIEVAIALFPDRPGIAEQVALFVSSGDQGYELGKRYLMAQRQVLTEGFPSSSVNLSSAPRIRTPAGPIPTKPLLSFVSQSDEGLTTEELRSLCDQVGIKFARQQFSDKLRNLRKRGFLKTKREGNTYHYTLGDRGHQLLANQGEAA